MDLHAAQIQGFFDIPVDNMLGSSVLIPYIAGKFGVAAAASQRALDGHGQCALEQVAFVAGDQVGRQEGVRIRRQHGRPRENEDQFCGAAMPGRKGGGPK